ncbi:serine/threonine-protein kinase [Candidatus Uabimicrobium amorphum]|uniref:Serine/threonine protein kinase n=1 Tax=Uabimicrobium amorphum TaxID=2596890 RepID=A0A5S9IUY0_UABAM|nr:serine/threonine-protein kinase [Candidatus Uabimicrobium amorphum]BBM87590.1 serine/threonine protein kinase [Candidatus Uabimicrobium amorphum]
MSELISNRYEVLSQIGIGGSGAIFTAIDTFLGEKVAIKKILLDDDDQIERLKRECFFLQTVNHPNLVKAYEFFIENDRAYMVLEFINGRSLDNIIHKNKRSMTLVGQLAIASQIARGIEVLNMGGIIHRDIKPQNIMLNTQTGEIKVVDLGTAKNLTNEFSPLTVRGAVVGTYCYMSPEQTNSKVTQTTDIFSLGILLHQFFTWSDDSPFYTKSIFHTLDKIRHEEVVDICELIDMDSVTEKQQQAYQKISKILKKALHKDPNMRWENAGTMADMFTEIRQPLLNEVQQNPLKYRIETSRQISPRLRKELQQMRSEYSSVDHES